ncbi:hypothetical protein OG885_42460 [Streptomyces sp. NBC_00028]|uniref:hypothetical protein n=1 Tax=Streptomyces sp. NBC_00028 TaxID=2975624 RepID=UPI003255F46D
MGIDEYRLSAPVRPSRTAIHCRESSACVQVVPSPKVTPSAIFRATSASPSLSKS